MFPRVCFWRQRRQRSNAGLEGSTATMLALVEDYNIKGLAPMTGASAANSLKPMRPRERRLGPSRRFYTNGLAGSTTMTGALEEEVESEDSTTMMEALSE